MKVYVKLLNMVIKWKYAFNLEWIENLKQQSCNASYKVIVSLLQAIDINWSRYF